MSRKIPRDKRLLVAKEMPPLYKTQPGGTYSLKGDEVFEWISKRPGLLSYVFDKLSAGGYIVYDADTGKWQGVNFDED